MKRVQHAVQSSHVNYSHSTLGHLKRKTAITMSSTSQSNRKPVKSQEVKEARPTLHTLSTGQYRPPLYMYVICTGKCQCCRPPLYMYLVLGNTGLPCTCTFYWAIPAIILHVLCTGQYQPPFYLYFVLDNTGLLSTCTLYWAILASFLHALCTLQYWLPFYTYFVLGNANTAGLPSTCTLCWAMPTLQAFLHMYFVFD